jgi:hypothetical protein
MKKSILWFLAFVITISAAIYQRKTGPTYPKRLDIIVNGAKNELKLVRSISISVNQKPEVRLDIRDTSVKAKLYYKRFKSDEEYRVTDFSYRAIAVKSFIMNKIFKIFDANGYYASVPQQPPAGKIEYYFEITDSNGSKTYLKDSPVIIRFKGDVPALILIPHILLMFIAMLFSTLAGLMSIVKNPLYKKYSVWTLILLIAGGFALGPVVQYFAFGDLWTGIPFGWDLTDNKTLIALIFWILAVVMNRKNERPLYTALAAFVLLLIFSIPHSLFGSELNYSSGHVTQGIILNLF